MQTAVLFISMIFKVFSVYFAIIALFVLCRKKRDHQCPPQKRFAILLAARNEAEVIEETVKSLLNQDYPEEMFDVFVIPNNCTDSTEATARNAGAQILRCCGIVRNKGDALHQAIDQLLHSDYDVFCVFDADNLVDRHFLSRMNDAFCDGAQVAKGKQRAQNPYDSWVSGCYDIYFEAFNIFFNQPRANCGLSAKLVGTGFAVSREFIRSLGGWNTETIAEDAEFAAQCATAGVRVRWVPEAVTYDAEPLTLRQSMVQRRRWCSGVMQVAQIQLPRLIGGLRRGNRKLSLDFSMFLMAPFVQALSFFPLAISLALLACGRGYWYLPVVYAACSYFATALGAFVLSCCIGHRDKRIWKGGLMFPVFMATWFPLQLISLFRKTTIWKQIVHTRSMKLSDV